MRVIVVDYDPSWSDTFQELAAPVRQAVGDRLLSVEHVGSTSVPGLSAKPVIDLDVIVRPDDVQAVITILATLGYQYRGDLGVVGREAFFAPPGLPAHHLYVCPQGSLGLRNHLGVRQYLRTHPDAAREYGDLKKRLAQQFPDDMTAYIEGKSAFLLRILEECGLGSDDRESIEESNRRR